MARSPEPFLRVKERITPTCHGSKSHTKTGQVRSISTNLHLFASTLFNLPEGFESNFLKSQYAHAVARWLIEDKRLISDKNLAKNID